MKAALVVLAFLLAARGVHVTLWCAGGWRSVPLPVLALVAELAACAVPGWLIARRVSRFRSYPFPRRLA